VPATRRPKADRYYGERMASRHLLFRVLYRLRFTPWDGHPLAQGLRELVEGSGGEPALPTGTALDVGCGTGDASIYLAQHGWRVTGVDFVAKALDKARAKARAHDVSIAFVHADVMQLSRHPGVGDGFDLIVDNGCLHGMSDADRGAYVREMTAIAAPNARLSLVAFRPGGSFGVRGISQAEIEQRLAPAWELRSAADEPPRTAKGVPAARYYLLQRRG